MGLDRPSLDVAPCECRLSVALVSPRPDSSDPRLLADADRLELRVMARAKPKGKHERRAKSLACRHGALDRAADETGRRVLDA